MLQNNGKPCVPSYVCQKKNAVEHNYGLKTRLKTPLKHFCYKRSVVYAHSTYN